MAGQNIANLGTSVNDPRSITAVAQGLSQHYGVKIRIGEVTQPQTDFSKTPPVIHIPLYTSLTSEVAALVRAFIDHEVAHVRFSDKKIFALVLNLIAKDNKIRFQSFMKLLNILEDVRVERCMGSYFPGSRENLMRGAVLVFGNNAAAAEECNLPRSAYDSLYEYIVRYVRSKDVPDLRSGVAMYRKNLSMNFSPLLDDIEPLLDKVDDCQSTRDCFELTQEIYAHILAYAVSEDLSGGQQVADARQELASIDPDKLDRSLRALGNRFNAKFADFNEALKVLDSYAQSSLVDVGDGIRAQIAKGPCLVGSYTYTEHLGDVPQHLRRDIHRDVVDKISRCSAMIRTRLQALLQAERIQYGTTTRYGTRVSTKKLACASIAPCAKPFLRKAPDKGGLTQVMALLDMSGSMYDGRRDLLAVATMYSLAQACCVRNVQFACEVFTGNAMFSLIRFGDRVPSHMYSVEPNGGTPLFSSGTLALWRFNPHAERRILILFSDGDAGDAALYKRFYALATQVGVELYGVGMCYTQLQHAMPDVPVCAVRTMDEFPGAVFNLLERALIRR